MPRSDMFFRAKKQVYISILIVILFFGVAFSNTLSVSKEANQLSENSISYETHSNLNISGNTAGSIYSASTLSASFHFTCALLDDNTMKCWGRNTDFGFLGTGDYINRYTPATTQLGDNGGDSTANGVSSYGHHTCAIMINGSTKCWGEDWNGQVGHGVNWGWHDTPYPTTWPAGRTATQISMGGHHSCAIMDDLSLWCWGDNSYGQIGNGGSNGASDVTTPEEINLPGGRGAISITAGWHHTCAILDDNSGWCWGENDAGQLGDGTNVSKNLPTEVSALPSNHTLVALSVATKTTCGIIINGSIVCWGSNEWGQYGDGTTTNSTSAKYTPLPSGRTAISIDVGLQHTCAILDDHSGLCWGSNTYGQIGDNTTTNRTTPTSFSMPAGLNISSISAGNRHTCVIASNASIYCWGSNDDGQLGLGENEDSDIPAYVDLGAGNHALLTDRDPDGDGILSIFDPYPQGCPVGMYSSNATCLETSPGWYAEGISPQYNQYPCDIGTFQPASGQTYCLVANAGYHVNSMGAITQVACDIGTYQPSTGASSCLVTAPGNFSASQASIEQTPCSLGAYQPNSGQTTCITTTPGHYVNSLGAHSQVSCAPGTYQPIAGKTSCFDASLGYSAPNESSTYQTLCDLGTYSPASGQSECNDASPGHIVSSMGQSSQVTCLAGQYQPNSGQTTCLDTEAGYYTYLEGTPNQIACALGTYQPMTGQTSCIEAQLGYHAIYGYEQTECLPGYYTDMPGQSECKVAESGSYVDVSGSSSAILCSTGSFQDMTGESSCKDAPAGYFVDSEGATGSTACPTGYYQNLPGRSFCVDSSPGNYVSSIGQIEQQPCASGTFQPLSAQSECVDSSPGNYVSIAGSSIENECISGTYQPLSAQNSCLDADIGNYVGGIGSDSQTECYKGKYQPNVGQESCILADPGHYVANTGASEQQACVAGTYQSKEGLFGCLPASTGYYVSEDGATEQIKCPSGETQPDQGQTSCIKGGLPGFSAPLSIISILCAIIITRRNNS